MIAPAPITPAIREAHRTLRAKHATPEQIEAARKALAQSADWKDQTTARMLREVK